MRERALFFFNAAFSLLLLGCGMPPAAEKPQETRLHLQRNECDTSGVDGSEYLQGIVGGKKLGLRNPIASRTVSLQIKEGSDFHYCTGSLLEGNVVLTAAHCLPVSASVADIQVLFTNNVSCAGAASKRPVKAMIANPHFAKDKKLESVDRNEDIALLRFEGRPPAGYQMYSFPAAVEISAKDRLILAGFGSTDFDNEDGGFLRITAVPLTRLAKSSDAPKIFLLQQPDRGVCAGDSGSGLVLSRPGKLYLIGVASAILNEDQKEEKFLCRGLSLFVSLAAHLPWLRVSYDSLLKAE